MIATKSASMHSTATDSHKTTFSSLSVPITRPRSAARLDEPHPSELIEVNCLASPAGHLGVSAKAIFTPFPATRDYSSMTSDSEFHHFFRMLSPGLWEISILSHH